MSFLVTFPFSEEVPQMRKVIGLILSFQRSLSPKSNKIHLSAKVVNITNAGNFTLCALNDCCCCGCPYVYLLLVFFLSFLNDTLEAGGHRTEPSRTYATCSEVSQIWKGAYKIWEVPSRETSGQKTTYFHVVLRQRRDLSVNIFGTEDFWLRVVLRI